MQSRNEQLKAMAEDCRRLAAVGGDEAVRLHLLAVAVHFDRLAEEHDPAAQPLASETRPMANGGTRPDP